MPRFHQHTVNMWLQNVGILLVFVHLVHTTSNVFVYGGGVEREKKSGYFENEQDYEMAIRLVSGKPSGFARPFNT